MVSTWYLLVLANDEVDDNDRLGNNQVFVILQVVLNLVVNKDWVIGNHRVNDKDLVDSMARQSTVKGVVKAGRAARHDRGWHGGET